MSDARSAIPGLAVVAQASGLDPTSLQDLLKATGKLLGFFGAGYLVYGSYGGAVPREYGVAWAWDFVDTFYFTSATLTTPLWTMWALKRTRSQFLKMCFQPRLLQLCEISCVIAPIFLRGTSTLWPFPEKLPNLTGR